MRPSFCSIMTLIFILLLAITLDYCLGEPPNAYHPLVAFGQWANRLETQLLNLQQTTQRQKLAGILAWSCALLPSLIGLLELILPTTVNALFEILVLYCCIGARSLQQHANAVYQALEQHDLCLARQQVGKIVSRQTSQMTAIDARRASIESVLENGADAVFAPLFWFILFGPFGALIYRLSNTLDAMWGYKNQHYQHFGWAAARFDDVLNWLPARLTALSYALLGNTTLAFNAWQNQAHLLDSPNAGPVMTAGAGALNLKLGGPACYHGQLKNKPWFGGEELPQNADIKRATHLIYQTLALWLLLIALGASLA